jgi:uncharacterized membrane protein
MTALRTASLGVGLAAIGAGALALRRRSHDVTHGRARSSRSVTIRLDARALYDLWRAADRRPSFVRGLRAVETVDRTHERWSFACPDRSLRRVDVEIVADEPGERFEWRTARRSPFRGGGSLTFTPAPEGRGTQARLALYLTGPGAKAVAAFHRLFGAAPPQLALETLRGLKALAETGEIPQAVRS